MNFRSTPLVWVGAGLLLLSPAVAMIFTDEVAWGLEDFAALALLLLAAGLSYEAVARLTARRGYRLAAGAIIGIVLLLVWAQLAVGIVD